MAVVGVNRDDKRVALLLAGTFLYVFVVITVMLAATTYLETAFDQFGARMAALAGFAVVWIAVHWILVATLNRLWPSPGGASA